MLKRLVVVGSICLFINACTNEGSAPGGGSLNIPQITSAVSGSSTSALVKPMASTGVLLNSATCSGCGGATSDLTYTHGLASLFVLQGKIADSNSCSISAARQFDLMPGLGEGKDVYGASGEVLIKANVQLSGDTVRSFEVYHCYNGTQVQFMSGTNEGGNVTFKFRSKFDSSFAMMDAEGTMDGDTWTSKTLDVVFSGSTNNNSSFRITQTANLLDITGVFDTGTIGTLDNNDYRTVARVELLGNTPATYALGDGSVRSASGMGGAANNNWNGDTGAHGAGPTTYDAAVAAASLPSVPSSYVTDFTSEEQWDCAPVGTPVNFQQAGAGNPALMEAMMACEEAFQ